MFGKTSTNRSAERLIEEQLYEQVVIELSDGKKRHGLWAKAIADSEGSEEKAKSLYIKYRVQSIKDELSLYEEARAKKEEDENRERQRKIEIQRALEREIDRKNFTNTVLRFFAFLGAAPSFLMAIGGIFTIKESGISAVVIAAIFGFIAYKLGRYAFFNNKNVSE